MNKKKLIAEISKRSSFTKEDSRLMLDTICDIISESLCRGEQIKIANFGVFKVKKSEPRIGKNFADNSTYPIPSRYVPVFLPGVKLKERVGGISFDD